MSKFFTIVDGVSFVETHEPCVHPYGYYFSTAERNEYLVKVEKLKVKRVTYRDYTGYIVGHCCLRCSKAPGMHVIEFLTADNHIYEFCFHDLECCEKWFPSHIWKRVERCIKKAQCGQK